MKYFKQRFVVFIICALFLVALTPASGITSEQPIVFLDLSWDSIQLHNRIAGYIVENGYGEKTDYLFSETVPGMLGLERGDIHVYMDGWVDNTPEWWREVQERKTVVNLGSNYYPAPQGWYVPTYVIKGDPERGIEPMAPDLEYMEDLGKYWELFRDPEEPDKGRFTNAPLGWKISSINRDKIESLGLKEFFSVFEPGSGTALKTQAISSYKKGKPILFYYWEPTALMGSYDFIRLKQRIPYKDELWTEDNGYNCDFPAPVIIKVLNREFAENNQWIVDFLKKYKTTLPINNAILSTMAEQEMSTEDAAIWFLKNYRDTWHKWIPEDRQDVLEKVEKALSEE